MHFAIEKDGKTVMQTQEESCIPDKETLQQMKKAGYKFKLNGKPYHPKEPTAKER